MPIIAAFYGLIVRMYHADHPPPHFHVQYGDMSAVIELRFGRIIVGKLPARLLRLVEEWRKLRRVELEKAWQDAQAMKTPRRIRPLE